MPERATKRDVDPIADDAHLRRRARAEGVGSFLAALARRGYERASASQTFRASIVLLLVGFVCLDVTLLLARIVGVRAMLVFPDTVLIMGAFGWFVLSIAAGWDGLLLSLGVASAGVAQIRGEHPRKSRWWTLWRRWGFFSIGIWPLPFVLVTIYFLIGTSNISNISLRLLESTTTWHDAAFWQFEAPFLASLLARPIDVVFWETIYNSGWQAEMTVLFAILVWTRSSVHAARFCVSFLLLFYLGRFLGLATPVQGPAFFVPDHYAYLDGSVTERLMVLVSATIDAGANASERGAALLGGVAAMPSLHVGMVSLAAWWLAAAMRWATPVAIVWLLVVWSSTVLLGWHYVLDGAGGIALAALCVGLTGIVLRRTGVDRAAPTHSGTLSEQCP